MKFIEDLCSYLLSKDVIQAYKGITKEKEALEASLNALADSNIPRNEANSRCDTDPGAVSVNGESKGAGTESKPNEDESKDQETIRQLKTQLATLSSSLATITAEKSRSEANFQSDRKRLLQEKDDVRFLLFVFFQERNNFYML